MNSQSPKPTLSRPVFFSSLALLVTFLAVGVFARDDAAEVFPSMQNAVSRYFGGLYVLSVTGFLGMCGWLLLGPYAKMRLGPADSVPEFSRLSWFSMLFSAGMGIGLVFNGVAEPMMHFSNPLGLEPGSHEAAMAALPLTYLHWGIHAWGIYAVVAIAIAFFSYRHGLPLAIRSCFYPIFGNRIYGWVGHVIDTCAVVATLFGLACSLGVGAMQISAGFNHLFDTPHTTTVQLGIIAVVTLAATVSLLTGIKKGIRRLSELNMVLATALVVTVALLGPTLELVPLLIESTGRYLGEIPSRSFFMGAFDKEMTGWVTDWTVMYWAWWIAWAPFVGMFVARVSRGRTMREFILGTLLVPTGVTIVWFAVFGGTALHLEINEGASIAAAVNDDISTAVYVLLEQLPGSAITALLAVVVVSVFFVTSSDSASLVVDMLTSGGHPNPPKWQRVFWATTEGVTAAILLYAGGSVAVKALQSAVVAMGLPFCVVLVGMCGCLVLGLSRESRGLRLHESSKKKREETVTDIVPMEFRKILVPVDYSDHSTKAIEHALGLAAPQENAEGQGGEVLVLHVSPEPTDYLPLERMLQDDDRSEDELNRVYVQAANEQLDEFLEEYSSSRGDPIASEVRVGVPWERIVERAEEGDFNLIVMGSHGQNKLESILMGSVAQRVINQAPCPVVVL